MIIYMLNGRGDSQPSTFLHQTKSKKHIGFALETETTINCVFLRRYQVSNIE